MGEEIYQKALEYAKKKHEGQFRIGGALFIVHPIAVAEILRQDGKQVEYRVAAVFHDLLEDTDASEQEIVEIGGRRCLKSSEAGDEGKKNIVWRNILQGLRQILWHMQ